MVKDAYTDSQCEMGDQLNNCCASMRFPNEMNLVTGDENGFATCNFHEPNY
jgi:hypothetical protein